MPNKKIKPLKKIFAKSDLQRPADYSNEMNFIYGDQTWGRVYKKIDKEFSLRKTAINNALRYIQETLDIFKIKPVDLKKMTVLDIGTGRQALQFHKLGAKEIIHFDISRQHIEQTQIYCKEHKIRNITSIQGDLTKNLLPTKKFDFVFAAGIYQHLWPPHYGLINFAQSLKQGGGLYMGFYRSGDWRWFIVSLIRQAVSKTDFAALKDKLAISSTLDDLEHFQIGRVLDDFFVPAQGYFHPKDILTDIKQCGLEKYYLENDMRDYCHESQNYHSVGGDRIYAIKKKHSDANKLLKMEFRTAKPIDQLRDIDYKEPIIRQNIDTWLEIVDLYNHGFIPHDIWLDILLAIYRFARPWDAEHDSYFIQARDHGRHRTLQEFLVNLKNNFSR